MLFGSLKKMFHSRPHPRKEPRYDLPLTSAVLKDIFSDCFDFTTREIELGAAGRVTVCYLDGLTDGNHISESIIRPLNEKARSLGSAGAKKCVEDILSGDVWSCNASEKKTVDDAVCALTGGFALVVFDREKLAVAFEAKSSVQRSISEPQIEKAVKGAKDAFVERIRTNTMLVRRKLRTPELKIIRTVVGRQSETEVDILYVSGVCDGGIADEVQKRLDNVDIDGLLATGNLEEYICDNPRSPFPQLMYTERPDRFSIGLLDGQTGILVDGLPLGFLVPGTLAQMVHVPEDRSQHYVVSAFLRLLRFFAAFVSITLPALYVAIAMYHQAMIPLQLLLSIIQSKQSVPFSTAVEILGMLLSFELLQEAGFRLPNPIGDTVGIIGALIVGQSAVEAKVVSPIAVIVVALAGISGYTVSNQDLSSAFRVCRFLLVVFALLAGMLGIMAGLTLLVYHLSRLESFGVPYLSPMTGRSPAGAREMMIRKPLASDKLRASNLDMQNRRNQK